MKLPEHVLKILRTLEAAGFEGYAVGGCVRDVILGRIPGDWDITTNAGPAEVKKLFRRTIDTGIEHGTVTVMMGSEGYEVTTYRIDGSYSDGRHPDQVAFTPELSEDLKRRDFTINAMACSADGEIVDLFGGKEDLKAGCIRCVGDPDARFTEDALRILRALRFSAQLDFEIEAETFGALRRHAPNLLKVSKERIFTELNKTILSAHPEKLSLLSEAGILPYIVPGFETVVGSERIAALPPEKHVRWAAAFCGLGGAGLRKILKGLKSDSTTINQAAVLADRLLLPIPETKTEVRFLLSAIGEERFQELMSLSRNGFGKDAGPEKAAAAEHFAEEILAAGDCLSLKELKVGGAELSNAGVAPGPQMGRILGALLHAVLEKPELNQKEELLLLAARLIEER